MSSFKIETFFVYLKVFLSFVLLLSYENLLYNFMSQVSRAELDFFIANGGDVSLKDFCIENGYLQL